MPVLFIDYACPTPYDLKSFLEDGLGGSEASTVRIAEKLGETRKVYVMQHNRLESTNTKNVFYIPFDLSFLLEEWAAVIYIRNPAFCLAHAHILKQKGIPTWVWMHDLISNKILPLSILLRLQENHVGLIAVSNFHKQQILSVSQLDLFFPAGLRVERIYNPIDDELQQDQTEYDPNKLVFISASIKGLDYTLHTFNKIKEKYPQFELYVSHPNYNTYEYPYFPGVTFLGTLKHAENMNLVRSALCLFHLNHIYPETFGLANAEANAVGTPVLTHPLGAVQEVISGDDQLVNTHDFKKVMATLLKWHKGDRPKVSMKEDFRLSTVIQSWNKLIA